MMQYKLCLSRIEFDDEANIFQREGVNIHDVITFQGKSVDDYLDFCSNRGEEPEKPYSGCFTVQLSPEQHRKVILAAENSGKDVRTWVSDLLTHATG